MNKKRLAQPPYPVNASAQRNTLLRHRISPTKTKGFQ